FRALGLFGRRPPERVERVVIAGSRKPAQKRTFRPGPFLCAFGRAFFFWRSINARCVVVIPFAVRPSLQDAIDAVHREFAKVFDANKRMLNARITTGRLLLDLRERIDSGEAGAGVKWWDWYRE